MLVSIKVYLIRLRWHPWALVLTLTAGYPAMQRGRPRKEGTREEQIIMNLTLRALNRARVHLQLPVFTSLLEKRQKVTSWGQNSINSEES